MIQSLDEYFWLLWAIKESAFKAVVQAGRNSIRFNPLDFQLQQITANQSLISFTIACDQYLFNGQAHITDRYVDALSYSGENQSNFSQVKEIDNVDYQQQAEAIRSAAIDAFSKKTSRSRTQLSIVKDQNQVPYFYHGHERLDNHLSLSHHGNFLAFAFSL